MTSPDQMHSMAVARIARGFTLTELMISIGIITILGAVALPAYRNYVASSERGVLVTNMATIEVFQEDFRLRNGSYAVNLADAAAIEAALDWTPQDDGATTYAIGDGDGSSYRFTAEANGISVCLVFPTKTPCP